MLSALVVAEGVDLDPPIGVAPCLLDTNRTQPSIVISKKFMISVLGLSNFFRI